MAGAASKNPPQAASILSLYQILLLRVHRGYRKLHGCSALYPLGAIWRRQAMVGMLERKRMASLGPARLHRFLLNGDRGQRCRLLGPTPALAHAQDLAPFGRGKVPASNDAW